MHRIILSSVACPVLQYFSTLSLIRHDFRKTVIEHKMCVLISSTAFATNVSHLRRIQRDIAINVHRYSCRVPVIFVNFFYFKCNVDFHYRF